MTTLRQISWTWILVVGLAGCTYQTNISTPLPIQSTENPAPTQVMPPATSPGTSSTAAPDQTTGPIITDIPITWGDLNLSGRLVYMIGAAEYDRFNIDIQTLDLKTGRVTTNFSSPENSWIYYATVSPDGKELAMSYTPPSVNGASHSLAIYVMPLDGSEPPEMLFSPAGPDNLDIQVEWSPDGRYLYYTEIEYQKESQEGQAYPLFKIYRRAYPDGQAELVAEKAYWPRLSADSSRLVYVRVEPLSYVNQLVLADPDGGHAHTLSLTGAYVPDTKDAPIFLPDGTSLMFSAPAPMQSGKLNWIETLMGVRSAKADGTIPSDWWTVPIAGGPITQITHLQTLALYASIAPDNQHIASFSADGIFVMNPDGSQVTTIIPQLGGIAGTLSWLP